MKTYTLEELEKITGILSDKDYVYAYSKALRKLKEEPKNQWTKEDAFDAILRAVKL